MKALYICRHTPFRDHGQKLGERLNCPQAVAEAKDSAAGHAFIDANPNLSLVIIGFSKAEGDDINAVQSPIATNGDSQVVEFSKPRSVVCRDNANDPPGALGSTIAPLRHDATDNDCAQPTRTAVPDDAMLLTPRQDEVLSLLRLGMSNKEIARKLEVAESTVKFHCIAIFRQLGVSNRTQAAIRAEELAAQESEQRFS